MTETQTILLAARTLIADPDCWAQSNFALDEGSWPVPPLNDRACRWCIVGALIFVNGEGNFRHLPAYAALTEAVGRSIVPWQDEPMRTHEEVLAAFDLALAKPV